MNMSRLIHFIGIEMKSILSYAKYSRHGYHIRLFFEKDLTEK
jgi:hypothetical protein